MKRQNYRVSNPRPVLYTTTTLAAWFSTVHILFTEYILQWYRVMLEMAKTVCEREISVADQAQPDLCHNFHNGYIDTPPPPPLLLPSALPPPPPVAFSSPLPFSLSYSLVLQVLFSEYLFKFEGLTTGLCLLKNPRSGQLDIKGRGGGDNFCARTILKHLGIFFFGKDKIRYPLHEKQTLQYKWQLLSWGLTIRKVYILVRGDGKKLGAKQKFLLQQKGNNKKKKKKKTEKDPRTQHLKHAKPSIKPLGQGV